MKKLTAKCLIFINKVNRRKKRKNTRNYKNKFKDSLKKIKQTVKNKKKEAKSKIIRKIFMINIKILTKFNPQEPKIKKNIIKVVFNLEREQNTELKLFHNKYRDISSYKENTKIEFYMMIKSIFLLFIMIKSIKKFIVRSTISSH